MTHPMMSRVMLLFAITSALASHAPAAQFTIQNAQGYVYDRLILDPAARAQCGVRQEISPDDGTLFFAVHLTLRATFAEQDPDRVSLATNTIELRRADRIVAALGAAERLGELKSAWPRQIHFDKGTREKQSIILIYPLTVEGEKVAITLGKQSLPLITTAIGPPFTPIQNFTIKITGSKNLDNLTRTINGVHGRPTRTITSHCPGGQLIAVDYLITPDLNNQQTTKLPVIHSENLILTDANNHIHPAVGYLENNHARLGHRRIDPAAATEITIIYRITNHATQLAASYLYQPVGNIK